MAEAVGHPITGFALYAVLIPVAHLTPLYNYALTHDLAHDNEHLAFLVIGYLFWRPVVGVEPSRHPLSPGLRMVYLMLAIPVDTFSGLALVSATHEMFPAYFDVHRAWGPSLVGDLHIGGAIMWVGGDTLMVIGLIPIVVQWVRHEDEQARKIDAELDAAEVADAATAIGTSEFELVSGISFLRVTDRTEASWLGAKRDPRIRLVPPGIARTSAGRGRSAATGSAGRSRAHLRPDHPLSLGDADTA